MSDGARSSDLMDRNAIRAVLVIPQGFGRDLRRGRPAPVQVLINGDNANTATTVMGYALTIIAQRVGALQLPARRRGAAAPLVPVEPRVWYNPELRSTLFLVPGPDRLHRDDHRGGLDGAVDRAREGARHDGAGADGAASAPLPFIVGKTHAVFRASRCVVGARHHPRVDGAVRAADARLVAAAAAVARRCSWSARSAWAC